MKPCNHSIISNAFEIQMLKQKNNFNSEMAVLDLINRHFWKSKLGPISAIALPLMFMVIFKILSISTDVSYFAGGLSSFLTLCIFPVTLITLPQMITEFKSSIILRKISVSRITSLRFSLILLFYYFSALICSSILVILLYAIFLNTNAPHYFGVINWGQLIYSLLNVYISSLAVGLFLGVMIKKSALVQILGTCIMLISMAFAGQLLPLDVIGASDIIKYISLFSPLSYGINLLNNVTTAPQDILNRLATYISNDELNQILSIKHITVDAIINGANIFNVKYPFIYLEFNYLPGAQLKDAIHTSTIYYDWHKILNLVLPWFITITFVAGSVKKFKWTSR